jgi:hypothetical protein
MERRCRAPLAGAQSIGADCPGGLATVRLDAEPVGAIAARILTDIQARAESDGLEPCSGVLIVTKVDDGREDDHAALEISCVKQ